MKTIDLYTKLKSMPDKDYVDAFLTYSASLVIAGVKPAVTLTLSSHNKRLYNSFVKYGESFLSSISLQYVELRKTATSKVLMIYDKNLLTKEIDKCHYKQFFIELGYPSKFDINKYLDLLIYRYQRFNCPHELGIFLGIPLDDVKDFMNCSPKKCLLCGYWKVYNNLKEAKATFSQFDMVRSYTINNILQGNLSYDIATCIKNSFHTYQY